MGVSITTVFNNNNFEQYYNDRVLLFNLWYVKNNIVTLPNDRYHHWNIFDIFVCT